MHDLTGEIVGKYRNLVVIGLDRSRCDGKRTYWKVRCTKCGRESTKVRNNIHDRASCKCITTRIRHDCDEVLYLACTPDRYELPVCVSDNLDELSQCTGVKKESIMQGIARNAKRVKAGNPLRGYGRPGEFRFYRIEICGGDEI